MFGKGGMGNLMKQAQQMQERMQKAQEQLAQMEVTGEAGAGMVKVTMTGSHSVRRIEIDPSLMEDDKELLEDLVAAACNDAVRRVEEQNKAKMGETDRWHATAARLQDAVLRRLSPRILAPLSLAIRATARETAERPKDAALLLRRYAAFFYGRHAGVDGL